jgi:tripartite-type tricarboxylate transporter receptor subunit TctC
MSTHQHKEHHEAAAEHHAKAAAHHRKAAEHYEEGDHEKGGHHAHLAHAHGLHATHAANEAAKHHAEKHDGQLAKAKPGTLSYGTFAFPAAQFMEKLKRETGADIVRVPFRGGAEIVTAVLSGSTPVAILALSNMIPQLQSGRIRVLMIQSKERSPLFPNVPTFAQAGYGDDFPPTWFGLFAPAGSPPPIVAKIATDAGRILDGRAFLDRVFIERGVEPVGLRLDDFARFIARERTIAERIVKDSGLQPE